MKRFFLSSAVVVFAMSLFAHPGHGHNLMSEGTLLAHSFWVIVPLFVGVVVWFSKNRKKAFK